MGVLCAQGEGVSSLVEGIRAGRCPFVPAEGVGYPVDPPPRVSRFERSSYSEGEAGAARELLAVVAQALALPNGPGREPAGEDCALIVGSCGFLYASSAELSGRTAGLLPQDTPFQVRGPQWGADLITDRYGLRGPTVTVSSGCSSSANALLMAAEMLQRGEARRAIVAGVEGLSAVTLGGFDSLLLLDAAGCRPFDRRRAGLQIGEAIAVIVLEADPERCGEGLARLCGGANLCDTHHLTAASPDGSVMREVMLEALAGTHTGSGEVRAVKAHGIGSIDSDRAEAAALRRLFGEAMPPVLALKRYVGHTLGACGSLETAALIGCLREGFMPAAAGFEELDPDLGIEPLRRPRAATAGRYLLNFFGFGGNYTSLVLELD